MNVVLIIVFTFGIAMYLISTILIYEFLKRKNDKTPNIFFINFYIFRFVDKYKRVTKGQNRRTGALYYLWIVSINITLLSAILLFVINVIIM